MTGPAADGAVDMFAHVSCDAMVMTMSNQVAFRMSIPPTIERLRRTRADWGSPVDAKHDSRFRECVPNFILELGTCFALPYWLPGSV